MTDLVVIATLEIEEGTRDELLAVLMRHRERCLREEPGTRAFEVLVPHIQSDQLMLYERYVDRAAFEAHWNGASLSTAKTEAGARLKNIKGVFCSPVDEAPVQSVRS